MTNNNVPKSKIALAAALTVVVLGYGIYAVYDAMSVPESSVQNYERPPTPFQDAAYETPEPIVSRQAEFIPSNEARDIITYEKQTSVQTARLNALNAQKNADEAAQKLNPTKPIAVLLEQIAKKPKEPSLIDIIIVKSLIESGGQIIGMVTVGGELIEVKRGSKIGDVSVTAISSDSITFSDGHNTKTRRVKNY